MVNDNITWAKWQVAKWENILTNYISDVSYHIKYIKIKNKKI